MINERTFSHNFSGFWRSALPNLESVLRAMNLGYERLQRPLQPESEPHRRDLISEVGFRLAAAPAPFSPSKLDDAFGQASAFLRGETDGATTAEYSPLTAVEEEEVQRVSSRIAEMASSLGSQTRTYFPEFRGLGMLEKCRGDIKVGRTIVEVKYVDRAFRSTDLKQAIVYATLANIPSRGEINEIVVYNPLRGTFVISSLFDLIFSASGRSTEDFEFEFANVLSSSGVSR